MYGKYKNHDLQVFVTIIHDLNYFCIMKQNIRNIQKSDLSKWVTDIGENKYRTTQIFDWIWKKGVTDFKDMPNIPNNLRNMLDEHFYFNGIYLENVQKSKDTTIKALFRLYDNSFIEGVIIPSAERITICISSQVGCKLKCKFCATGTIGFKRNLEAGEIYDQVKILNDLSLEHFNKRITNIVFMGMGEPLYNYTNVTGAIHWISSDEGLGFSSKRITLSTIGIPVMIKKMADDQIKYNLAVSLHSAIQEKRKNIMPVSRNHTLELLLESLQYFTKITKNKITFEYVLLKGINDSQEDAEALIKYASHLANKINLIEYNPVEGLPFQKSGKSEVFNFMQYIKNKGMNVQLRVSRGEDIDAACGQLANKLLTKPS